MFGHDNNDKKDDNNQPVNTQPVNPGLLGIDDDSDSTSTPPEPTTAPIPGSPEPPASSFPVTPNPSVQSPVSDAPTPVNPAPNPVVTPINDNFSTQPDVNDSVTATTSTFTDTTSTSGDDLVDIKRQALQELSPLIDHLEQDSEEKFKTTMMMIQASDDKDLIPQAFRVAKEISDDKKRAQALLDIVNEINYFTHKTED